MNQYKEKYIKYKKKYINLRQKYQMGGVNEHDEHDEHDIYDFDKYYLNENKKYYAEYFLNKKISSTCLETIKNNFQCMYYKFYEYLTKTSCEHIVIPLFFDKLNIDSKCIDMKIDADTQFRVNYVEQAKYYNNEYRDLLLNINNYDDLNKIFTDYTKNLINELNKLISLNTINDNLNLNYLLEYIKSNSQYNEIIFFIENILYKFINSYKIHYYIPLKKYINKIFFQQELFIDILKSEPAFEIKLFNKEKECIIQQKIKKEKIEECISLIQESKESINVLNDITPVSSSLDKTPVSRSLNKKELIKGYENIIIDDKFIANIQGSCASISFIYKCFYLINKHIPHNNRMDIIHAYIDSLDECTLIKLILYIQHFVFTFISNIKDKKLSYMP